MQLDNLTTKTFVLDGHRQIILDPSETNFVISDSAWIASPTLRDNVNGLLSSAKVSIDTPPAGWVVVGGQIVRSSVGRVEFTNTIDPGADATEVSITKADPGDNMRHCLTMVSGSYDDATGVGLLTVESPSGTELFSAFVANHFTLVLPEDNPIRGATSEALIVRLASGGAGIAGVISVKGYTTGV